MLKQTLADVSDNFDFILIDCPSSLGLLTLNGLAAADSMLMPTQPHLSHMRGLWLFLGTMERIKRELNPDLSLMGILLTYFNPSLPHHQSVLSTMRAGGLPILPVALEPVPGSEDELPNAATTTYVPGSFQALQDLAQLVEDYSESGGGTGPLNSLRLRYHSERTQAQRERPSN